MELELRYTLESFEGQLSAMAREKVAIQKQVKELSGQCTTLRKQVCLHIQVEFLFVPSHFCIFACVMKPLRVRIS